MNTAEKLSKYLPIPGRYPYTPSVLRVRLVRTLGRLSTIALLLFSQASWGAEAPAPAAEPATNVAAPPLTRETAKAAVLGDQDLKAESPLVAAMKGGGTITGGTDPHGDSWASILSSVRQFGNPLFVLRLFLSLALAVVCSWVIAWHPRSLKRGDPLTGAEERKALTILGVVGAIVAELSGTSPTLAFVIFGIGALLRFRTVLDNPKATGKAILVVVIGLACGMGSWTMAVFVTAFSWGLLYWLDMHVPYRLTIRLENPTDAKALQGHVQALLTSRGCRVHGCEITKGGRRVQFVLNAPATLDPDQLQAAARAELAVHNPRVSLEEV